MSTEKNVNYTEEMVAEMVTEYEANPTRETVEALAEKLGKAPRSVIAKLVREGVYKAPERTTKTGAPIVRKSELLVSIQDALGVEVPTLVKASKADLEALAKVVAK